MLSTVPWEQAILQRRSVRHYQIKPLERETLEALKQFAKTMVPPFDHGVEIRFFKAEGDKKLYTLMTAPPDNMAFFGHTDCLSISKAGFIGELMILYATSLGIGTCWYGHYTLDVLEQRMPHLGVYFEVEHPKWGYGKGVIEGERAICISPLGRAKTEGLRVIDRIQESTMSFKRKPLESLLMDERPISELSAGIVYALNLARLAPSAANSQHWRFYVSEDQKKVTIHMPEGYKHIKWEHPNVDIGICACHFWLGLQLSQMGSRIELVEDKGRAIWTFHIGEK